MASGQKEKKHPIHQGVSEKTCGAKAKSLDEISGELKLTEIKLLKINTDGNEADILLGGMKTIEKFKPKIVMEWADYLVAKKQMRIALIRLFKMGYEAYFNEGFSKNVNLLQKPESIRGIKDGSLNLVIVPNKNAS